MTSLNSPVFKLENHRLVSDTSWSPSLFPQDVFIPSDDTPKITQGRLLRFDGSNNPNISVNPSGLVLLNKQNQMNEVYLTQTYSTGIHIWEIFSPQDCYGTTFGIKNTINNSEQTFQFLASSAKIITFKLDLQKLLFKSWVNSSPIPRNCCKQITEGSWIPFVRIKVKGRSLILNPSPADPESKVLQYNPWTSTKPQSKELQLFNAPKIVGDMRSTDNQVLQGEESLITLDENKVAVINKNKLRIIYKNTLTNQFQFQNIAKVVKKDNLVLELAFTSSDFEHLKNYCAQTNLKFFKGSVNSGRGYFYIENSLQDWIYILKESFVHCDVLLRNIRKLKRGDNTTKQVLVSEEQLITIYRILLEKVEQIKPHFTEPIREISSLQTTYISQWDYSKQLFKKDTPKFIVSKSHYQNNIPALSFKHQIQSIHQSQNYLVVKTKESIELFNIQFIPLKLSDISLNKGFNKAFQLQKFDKVIQSIKIKNPDQPKLYKILADCLVQSKLAKRIPKEIKPDKGKDKEKQKDKDKDKLKTSASLKQKTQIDKTSKQPFVDKKILDALINMGFSAIDSKNSIIATKNVSVDAALQHLISNTPTTTTNEKKQEWACSVCTLINVGGVQCSACASPRPEQSQSGCPFMQEIQPDLQIKQVEQQQVAQNRSSVDLGESLNNIILIETGIFQCPLIIVGIFNSQVRVRLVGPNPTYLKYFSVCNEQMYMDLSRLVPEVKMDFLFQKPLSHLQQIFVGATRLFSYQFGWITLQDADIQVKTDKIIRNRNNLLINQKNFKFQIKTSKLYDPLRSSISVIQIEQNVQLEKPIALSKSVTYQNKIRMNSRNTLEIDLVFRQLKLQNSSPLSETKVVQSSIQPICKVFNIIPLLVHSAPNTCNHQYPLTSVVYENNPNQIVLKHQHNKSFTVQRLILQSSGVKPASINVKKGYFYMTNHLGKSPVVKYLFEYDISQEMAYFVINNKVPAKYIIIEPIITQQQTDSIPFEMMLYGVSGSTLQIDISRDCSFQLLQKYIKLQLQGINSSNIQRLQNYQIKEYLLNDTIEVDHLNKQGINNRVQQYLKHNIPVDVLVQITLKNLEDIDLVRMKQVSIEGWKLISSKMTAQQSSNSQKRRIVGIFEELIKSADEDTTTCLIKVMEKDQLSVQNILSQMSFTQFFDVVNKSNIDQKQLSVIIRQFSIDPKFQSFIDVALFARRIQSADISPIGLQFIFELLKVSECDKTPMHNVLNQSLAKIRELRNPEYTQERQRKNYHLVLQNSFFSDYYYKQVQNQSELNHNLNNRIISKFVMVGSNLWRKYIIDLTNLIKVDSLLLSFENNNQKKHLFIQIYKVNSDGNKEVVFIGYYEEWVWQQLCKNSYSEQTKKIIQNYDQSYLNSLNFEFNQLETRYLILELNFDLAAQQDMLGKPVCTSQIIPEVFGSYQGEADPQFIQYFDIASNKPTFISHAKFHTLSQFGKYVIKKDQWTMYYYDNEELIKPSKSSNFASDKVKNMIKMGSKGLDYQYTITCKTIDLLMRDNNSLSIQLVLELYSIIIKQQSGPIRDKAMSLIRKIITSNEKIYVQILKISKGGQTIEIFEDISFKEKVVNDALLSQATKQLVSNILLVLRLEKVDRLNIIDTLILKTIDQGLEQKASFLLQDYPWTENSSLFIKKMLNSNKAQALRLTQKCNNKAKLLADVKDWIDTDEHLFQEIITHIKAEPTAEISKVFRTIISRLLEKRGRKTYKQLHRIIELSNSYGIDQSHISLMLNGLQNNKRAYELFDQVVQLALKTEVGTKKLLQYFVDQMQFLVNNKQSDFRNLKKVLESTRNIEVPQEIQNRIATCFVRFLENRCSFGGYEGLKITSNIQHSCLQFSAKVIQLLKLPLQSEALQSLVRWYLLNSCPTSVVEKNPTVSLFLQLRVNDIEPLILMSNARVILNTMFKTIKDFQQKVNQIISVQHRIELDEQIMNSFRNIYQKLTINVDTLNSALIQTGMFEYIVNRIKRSGGSTQNNKINRINHSNSLNLLKGAISPKDWLCYKEGNQTNQAAIINFRTDADYEQLIFKSQNPIMLDNILLSFVVNTGDKKIVCPKNVQVWAGKNENDIWDLGDMELVKDDHYLAYGTIVFGTNFKRLRSHSVQSYIDELNKNSPIRYLKFLIEKPQPISIEDVLGVNHKTHTYQSKISFLSIIGNDNQISKFVPSLVPIFPILSHLCNPKFSQTLGNILCQQKLTNFLKDGLQSICACMEVPEYFQYLHLFVISVSKNDELGDFIIDKYLNFNNPSICAKLVSQITISNYDLLEQRLLKLHNFVMSNIHQEIKSQIVPFIVRETNILHLISRDLQNSPAIITLNLQQSDLQKLLKLMYTTKVFNQQILEFISTLLLLAPPFALVTPQAIEIATQSLWSQWKKNKAARKLFASLIIGNDETTRWIMDHNRLDSLIQETISMTNSGVASTQVFVMLDLFTEICYSPKIKNYIEKKEFGLNLFKTLTTIDNNLSLKKSQNGELRKVFVSFITNSLLGTTSQKQLAVLLKQSLDKLITNFSHEYVTEVFLPILNSSTTIPVCFEAFDPEAKRFTLQPCKDLKLYSSSLTQNKIVSYAINSKVLSAQHISQFQKLISNNFIPTLIQYQNKDCYSGIFPNLKNKVFKQTNDFVIFVAAENKLCKKQYAIYCHNKSQNQNSTNGSSFYDWNPQSFIMQFTKFENQEEWKTRVYRSKGKMIQLEGLSPNSKDKDLQAASLTILREGQSLISLSLCDQPSKIETGFRLKSCEYFTLKHYNAIIQKKSNGLVGTMLSSLENPQVMNSKYVRVGSAINNLRKWTIYHLPKQITISHLKSMLNVLNFNPPNSKDIKLFKNSLSEECKDNQTIGSIKGRDSPIANIQYNYSQFFNEQFIKKIGNASAPLDFLPKQTILSSFEQEKGIEKLIDVVSSGIKSWKKEETAKKWQQYIQQLKSFSNFPHFFRVYMKEKDTTELLLNILIGLPDKQDQKKWQEMENKAIKNLYKIISQVLAIDNTVQLRQYAIEYKFITTILDRLHLISKQVKRRFEADYKEEQVQEKTQKANNDEVVKKVAKKKGTGYGNDNSSNNKWATTQKSQNSKQISEQLENILSIVQNFLNVPRWKIPKTIINQFMQSCLLPLIQNTLRAGTLLEISKDSKRVMAVLNLLLKIASHNELVPCLMKISQKYQPSQSQSISQLLQAMANTAQIFLSCLKQGTSTSNSEQDKTYEANSRKIIQVWQKIEDVICNYDQNTTNAEEKMNDTLSLPLLKKYRQLLKDLKFDYINMKDNNNKMKHHYASYSTNPSTNTNKMIRLAQQLADLSTSLPTDHTNAIYVRCDKDRIDYMQALIMGSNGTPYGHGAYLFDIYFEDTYPNGPPKVNLTTTGSGKVRFNPNLYACGKVCLSLLGTWRGNASQNWDPKLSTLLQVLVSIQAIIMSDDIYFNEPGFQGQQGTEQGNKKNEAYSNIVRYCNIKFAMIENIKKPPNGFETIIRRHFYLKKNQILEQVEKWVKFAQKREASYIGLVKDHNNSWCTQFGSSKTKYSDMLNEAYKELKAELQKLPVPSISDITPKRRQPAKKQKQAESEKQISQQANLQEIDVSYNPKSIVHKELDINDEKVKDRWSRYIGAMGIDAVSKQAKASILVFGIGPFSLEVVKNLILSGCKRLTICDDENVSLEDLSGGFYFSESDIGKNRVVSCLHKLQELNQYVKVDQLTNFDVKNMSTLKEYNLVLMTQGGLQSQMTVDQYCRNNGVKFISAECRGPFFKLFNDFGDKFQVLDKNGEQPTEVMIKSITNEERGKVTLIDGSKHPYEDGQVVIINNINGMANLKDSTKSINGTLHKIQTINSSSFYIEDTRDFSPYVGNGTAKNVKLPITLNFPPLQQVFKLPKAELPIDQNMSIYDFSKMEHNSIIHYCFMAVDQFYQNQKRLPAVWNQKDSNNFIEIYTKISGQKPTDQKLIRIFSMTCTGNLPPMCAFFGGFVSQEIVKAITQKYRPTKSLFYGHFSEVVPKLPQKIQDWPKHIESIQVGMTRSRGFEIVVGKELVSKLQSCKVFMIGAGAIGCELLKNFAMINLACGKDGMITLTDPDHIQTSNLNRQFLFREKHIQKPKSSTAAASAIQMNPLLKGHVSARLDKIHDGTKGIYSDNFFQSQNIVANALDNVQARRYVDQRCVDNKIPLLQSGTLGPKGHVQVIIPYKTESYGSKNDPNDQGGEIPHCTLKMFPQETLHCIEWARDKFGQKFSLQPKAILKVLDKTYIPDSSETKVLGKVLRQLKKRPTNFDDCIHSAVKKFYRYYRDDVKQLLYTYPLDAKTKNGDPFWKLPKRPPTPIEQFDPEDLLHCTFVTSYAVMLAKIFQIAYPKSFRTEKERKEIGKIASKIKIQPFVPSDKKAKEIMKQTKDKEKDEEQQKEKQLQTTVNQSQEDLMKQIKEILSKEVDVSAQEFQKDDDSNGHIDFIYSMANLRSLNYKLDPMDWVTTKIKAGRIVPALSTTTTSIAGLQTLELVKYIANVAVDAMRNTFLNLAVPLIQLSEPGQAVKTKLHEQLSFTIWDRWQVKCTEKTTFMQLLELLQVSYKLKPKDILQFSKPIYLSSTFQMSGKEKEKENFMKTKILDVLQREQNCKYIDLIVTFTQMEDKQLIKEVPKVRLVFSE